MFVAIVNKYGVIHMVTEQLAKRLLANRGEYRLATSAELSRLAEAGGYQSPKRHVADFDHPLIEDTNEAQDGRKPKRRRG